MFIYIHIYIYNIYVYIYIYIPSQYVNTQPTSVNTTVCSFPIATCTAGDLPNNSFVSRVVRCRIRTPPYFCIHYSPNSIFCFRCLSSLAVAAAAADRPRCGRAGLMLL